MTGTVPATPDRVATGAPSTTVPASISNFRLLRLAQQANVGMLSALGSVPAPRPTTRSHGQAAPAGAPPRRTPGAAPGADRPGAGSTPRRRRPWPPRPGGRAAREGNADTAPRRGPRPGWPPAGPR